VTEEDESTSDDRPPICHAMVVTSCWVDARGVVPMFWSFR